MAARLDPTTAHRGVPSTGTLPLPTWDRRPRPGPAGYRWHRGALEAAAPPATPSARRALATRGGR